LRHTNFGLQNSPGRPSLETLRVVLLCCGLVFSAGCVRGCTSRRPPIDVNPNMDNQPKYIAQSENRVFSNGATLQAPVEGTVARGELYMNPAELTGKDGNGSFVSNPFEIDEELLNRGEKAYEIYCVPCHARSGNGESMLKQRSAVQTANLLEDRIRQMADGEMFGVITNGVGLMSGYRYPIGPEDRWAVVAHVRKLQESQ
jgi:mono/diheme cytochrome c family protein